MPSLADNFPFTLIWSLGVYSTATNILLYLCTITADRLYTVYMAVQLLYYSVNAWHTLNMCMLG